MDFEFFFETAFKEQGFDQQSVATNGKSFEELMQSVNYAENWLLTLLKALKAWEAAMKVKKEILPHQTIMYGNVATETNFFLYVYVVEPGANGAPVIKRQVGKFNMREYTDKLREAMEFARPYLKGADLLTNNLLGDGK